MSSKHLSWFVKRFIQMGLVSIDIHRYVVDFESVIHQESAKVLRNIYHRWGYDLFKLLLKDIDSLDILRMLSYYLGTMGVASGISSLGQGGYYSLSLRGHGVFLYLILGIEQSHNFSFKSQVSILTEQMELQRHNRGHYGFHFPMDMCGVD